MYNGYVKELDDDTKRKNEIETVTKLLQENPNNPYWQSRYNELVIKPIYGENWEADADRLHELLHPVDEKHAVDEASDLEYSESYRRFLEANKPKEDSVDYGI